MRDRSVGEKIGQGPVHVISHARHLAPNAAHGVNDKVSAIDLAPFGSADLDAAVVSPLFKPPWRMVTLLPGGSRHPAQ